MDDRTAFLRATWANVIGNVLKIVVEGGVGVTFGSLALVADAAHSLADLLASLVVLVWGRLSFEGPDSSHPHGHDRVEPLTALFVGVTLVALGLRILYDAGLAVLHAPRVVFDPLLVGGLAFAIVDMVVVYRYTTALNDSLNSPALSALAADCLNDVYTSLAVVVGVFGAAVGEPLLDPLAGGLVSILVVREGIEISRENVNYLVGRAPPESDLERIRDAVLTHPDVRGIHDFTAHYVGPRIEVEVHVEVDADYTLTEAHGLETELRDSILALQNVGDVHVHLDPAGVGEWKDAPE